jgi:enolase
MTPTAIARIIGRRVWDSRARPTVEADVVLAGGAQGRAIAPAGASTGSGEAVDLRDGGPEFGGLGVSRAVAGVNGEIAEALHGLDATDQGAVDAALRDLDGTPDKSRLGGNALIAVSMASAKAAAAARAQPLWAYLAGESGKDLRLPLPEIQLFGGGAHAGHRIDLQDIMVTAIGARDYVEALDWTAEVYAAAGALLDTRGQLFGLADEGGYWPAFKGNESALRTAVESIERAGLTPGQDMALSLDIAASQFGAHGRYRLAADGRSLDSDGLGELLENWLRRYPIVSVEDPFAEDDPEGFSRFTAAAGQRVQIVGDDFLVTDARRIREAAASSAANAVLIKPNQAGTLSEAREALDAARESGFGAIVSARSGESEDVTVTHLAVGWQVPQLKVGSFARGERTAKWNEGLRIAEALGGRGELHAIEDLGPTRIR